ncbi:MAG: Pvc16 family protein [Deltaproteobacteria bacterium]
MSHLVIAGVTTWLQTLLDEAAHVVPGAHVTFARPGAVGGFPRIGVYLYGVELGEGESATLDLLYLVSFFGDDEQLHAQRLLASAVDRLNGGLRLEDAGAVAEKTPGAEDKTALAEALAGVTLAPEKLEVDALMRIWTAAADAPYAVSLAYRVRGVRV